MMMKLKDIWHLVCHDKSLENIGLSLWLISFIFYLPVSNVLDGCKGEVLFELIYGIMNAFLFIFSFLKWKNKIHNQTANPRYILWFLLLLINFVLVLGFELSVAAYVIFAS